MRQGVDRRPTIRPPPWGSHPPPGSPGPPQVRLRARQGRVKGVKGSLGDATVPGGQLSGTAAPPGPSPGDSPQQDEGITRRVLLGFQRASSAPCVPASFSYTILPIMPRDGALILSEVRVPVLSVVCEPCGRRERYDVERLMRQYGRDCVALPLSPSSSPLPFTSWSFSASRPIRYSGPPSG
jgi:hypothetical protein